MNSMALSKVEKEIRFRHGGRSFPNVELIIIHSLRSTDTSIV